MDTEHLFLAVDGESPDAAIAAYTEHEYTVLLDLCATLVRAWIAAGADDAVFDVVEQIEDYVIHHHPDWQG